MEGMLDGIGCLLAIALISIPLGLWKLVEIIIWICSHLHWS